MPASWSRSSYEPLPAVIDTETALDPKTPVIHTRTRRQSVLRAQTGVGDVDEAFANADAVVEATFIFGRHTGVTPEPRAVVADWNPGEQS